MALTVDQLNIQITSDSQKATRALTSLIKKLEQLKATMSGSAVSNITIANSFNKTTNSVNKTDAATKKYDNTLKRTSKSSKGFLSNLTLTIVKWRTLFGVFNAAARVMGDWFKESNDYIETLNLFNVTMGDGAEEARKYAESVSNLMGIDAAEWMQNQGVFKNLVSGFGVAEDAANTMSQNLTQLSYDMASFFNTDVETAFDKLSSAMSGQVKGLREFGIDTTVASLQEYALAKGIDAKVRSMTQAEKSMLRYNYIMEKSIIMQGDMARTIVTPANALRILNAQLTQMKRALGNIISVLVAKFIPYIQAMVSIITDAANALAKFFGFELPKIDYSSLGSGFGEEMEEGIEDASGAAKKLKKQLMGFDELNILSSPDKDSGSGSGGAGGALNGMQPLEYDFLKNLDTSKADEIKEKMKDILKYVGLIAAGITAWKLGSFITSLATAGFQAQGLWGTLSFLGTKLALTATATITIAGIALETKGIISALKDGLSKINFGEILGGAFLTTAGATGFGSLLVTWLGKIGGTKLAFLFAEWGTNLGVATTGALGAVLGAGIAGIIAGIPMFFVGIYDAIKNGLSWLNSVLIPTGATMAGAGIGAIIGMLGGPIGAGVGALIGLAVGLVTDLVILIVENWESITEFFAPAAAWFDTYVIQPVASFFSGLWNGIVNAASGCWNAIVNFFTPAVTWFSQLFGSIWQTTKDVFYNIGVIASGCWEVIKVVWGKASTWFSEKVITPVKEFFAPMWEGLKEGAKKAWEGIKSVFSSVGTFFKNIFSDAWRGIVKIFSVAGDIFVDIKDGIVSAFKVVVNGLIKGLNSVVSVPFNGINTALNWIKKVEIVGIKPFADLRTINIPQIPLLASGGMVDAGQMFIAREAGPELVGSIGRKTAVANNDQIVSGIEAGVYRAMVAANSGNGGGSQTIRIINEIDGDIVGEKVIQYHNGKVMQTGASPLLV